MVLFNHYKKQTQTKRSEPFHGLFYHRYLQNETGNSQFCKEFFRGLIRTECKIFADMTYGILASQSCLLTKISHALQEKTKKAYTVDRLSDRLKGGINVKAMSAYLNYVRKMVPSEPVVHIDDSDVIKPDGYHFEALGIVRDGSKSTTKKCVYAKGYHVTEACVLTDSNHPASIYSRIHSSHEKGFTSVNHITFEAIDRSVKLLRQYRTIASAILSRLFAHFRSSKNGKYIQYSSIFGTLNWGKNSG